MLNGGGARKRLGIYRRELGRMRNPKLRAIHRQVNAHMVGRLPLWRPRKKGSFWAVTLVKNEIDIIELSVRHFVDQGAERVLVADNGSTDGTLELLRRLAEELPIIVIEDRLTAYHQGEKMSFLARAAWRGGADWVVPFDADELWYAPAGTLRGHLAASPSSIIDANIFNAYPIDGEPGPYRVDTVRHDFTQCCFRSHPVARLANGNHTVNVLGRKSNEINMLHIPWRSKEQMRMKVTQGWAAIEATGAEVGFDGHWGEMSEAKESAIDEIWASIALGVETELDFGYKARGSLARIEPSTWTHWPDDFPAESTS
ncbi:conserved hypothetical protein [Pseudoclavibacter sp. 8L]|nr:conserved hypothetical protein [Pseudoclavibacter sp. 8L]